MALKIESDRFLKGYRGGVCVCWAGGGRIGVLEGEKAMGEDLLYERKINEKIITIFFFRKKERLKLKGFGKLWRSNHKPQVPRLHGSLRREHLIFQTWYFCVQN